MKQQAGSKKNKQTKKNASDLMHLKNPGGEAEGQGSGSAQHHPRGCGHEVDSASFTQTALCHGSQPCNRGTSADQGR